jgi:hypothetical protein
MQGISVLGSILYFAGMIAIFVGERVFGAGTPRVLSVVGAAMVGLAIILRVARARSASGDAQRVERTMLMLYGLGALSVAIYFLQSDLAGGLVGMQLDKDMPKLAVVLEVLWPALWTVAAAPIVLTEMAYAAVARAPRLERARIHDAMRSGLGLAAALIFAFAIAFAANGRDKKYDLSYFHTAKPGESTKKIVATLDAPVKVSLFFPPANEVHDALVGYFEDLQKESKQLEVNSYDHAINPTESKELGVSGNGILVVSRDKRKELFNVGTEIEAARSNLQNLDKEVQKRLLLVSRPARTAYLVSGHGERLRDPMDSTDKRFTVKELRDMLGNQGYTVRDLGAAEGLAVDVPKDAALVMLNGPQKPLLAEEVAALQRYVDGGGRIFVALDPEAGLDMKELLGPLGVSFHPVMLANDQIYARKNNQASDKWNIATGSFSSHPSVTSLSHLGMRAPLILVGSGYLEAEKDKPKEISVDFTVHAQVATWNDLDNNFAFDPPKETRKAWELAAAITKKAPDKDKRDGRVLVLSDSDAISDGVVGNPGNAYFVIDGVKWLLGDEAITGEISSEVDVAIAHTKRQDLVWFYGSIFLAPGLALGIGGWATRRRRSRAKKEAA